MSAPRDTWLRASALVIGVLAPLVGAELLLRFLPVYDSAKRTPVNEEDPIARFEPNREFTWSRDWNFSIYNTVQVNNAGFVSDVDYHADAPGPLLAVVGDSFVEALMVPYRQTCAGRLATMLEPAARVYSFGIGDIPLAQYLAYARHARDAFRPQGLVVVVVENDLRRLLFQPLPGIHVFVDDGTGRLAPERPGDYAPSLALRLARRSALLRYLGINLGWHWRLSPQTRVIPRGSDDPTNAAWTERIIDAFLDLLPEYSGLGPDRIVLVTDGLRPELYDDEMLDETRGTFGDAARRYFLANAASRGYETIDMQPRFRAHYRKHRRRFEWPQDSHWNALGHERCFEAVRSSKLLSGAFPAS